MHSLVNCVFVVYSTNEGEFDLRVGKTTRMPVERIFLETFGMTYVRATRPFVPSDLFDRIVMDLKKEMPLRLLSLPMIVDLRAVDLLHEAGIETPVERIGWPDEFVEHGKPDILRAKHGITAENALAKVLPHLPSKAASA